MGSMPHPRKTKKQLSCFFLLSHFHPVFERKIVFQFLSVSCGLQAPQSLLAQVGISDFRLEPISINRVFETFERSGVINVIYNFLSLPYGNASPPREKARDYAT